MNEGLVVSSCECHRHNRTCICNNANDVEAETGTERGGFVRVCACAILQVWGLLDRVWPTAPVVVVVIVVSARTRAQCKSYVIILTHQLPSLALSPPSDITPSPRAPPPRASGVRCGRQFRAASRVAARSLGPLSELIFIFTTRREARRRDVGAIRLPDSAPCVQGRGRRLASRLSAES
jgi:hypothetical protein